MLSLVFLDEISSKKIELWHFHRTKENVFIDNILVKKRRILLDITIFLRCILHQFVLNLPSHFCSQLRHCCFTLITNRFLYQPI